MMSRHTSKSGCAGLCWEWTSTVPGDGMAATMSTWPRVPNRSESRVRPAGKPDDVARRRGSGASSASTSALLSPGLRPGSSWTVSVTRTVPSPSTWMPPPSFTSGETRRPAPGGPRRPRHERVLVPGGPVLAAPAVEDPVDGAEPAAVVEDERGADVPHPGVVQRGGDHLDIRVEVGRRGLHIRRRHQHGDRFEFHDGVRDGGPDGAGGVGFCRCFAQGVAAGGERHPDTVLGRRFGRHPPRAHAVALLVSAPSGASGRTGSVSRPYVSGRRVARKGKSVSQSRRWSRSRSATSTADSSRGAWARIRP